LVEAGVVVAVDVDVDVLGDAGVGVAEEAGEVFDGVPLLRAQVAETWRREW
jgi:hypothetical protein